MGSKKIYRVTSKQVEVLLRLYAFRFGTTDLLARSLGLQDGRYIHTRLEALVEQAYVGKKYDSSYKPIGKPAAYFLLPSGIAAVKQYGRDTGKPLSIKTLRNSYKDREASEAFIARKLAIFTVYDSLRRAHGRDLGFFTKDMTNFGMYDYMPRPKPDIYIFLTSPKTRPRKQSFLLYYLDSSTPFFVHIRHLKRLGLYVEDEEWNIATDTKLRAILLVCESTELFKGIRKKLVDIIDEADSTKFAYTTLASVKNSTPEDSEIWQHLAKPLELFDLTTL